MPFDTFDKILRFPLRTHPYFWGYTLKRLIGDPKVLPFNTYERDNKLDPFFILLPKGFWRTPGILPVIDIVNHMFIIFAFSLYNMSFFTPPYLLFYQRYSSEMYRQTCFGFDHTHLLFL